MPSENKVSLSGLLLLFLGTTFTGAILSFAYLWLNEISPFIYLCIIAAVALGSAVGFVSALIIKLFKINNTSAPALPALCAVILGCLVFSYFKWALYVARDSSNEISYNYINWYMICYADDFLDAEGNLYSVSELNKIITDMRNMTAYEYIKAYGQEELWALGTWENEELQVLSEYTFYDYMEHNLYLSNGSVSDAVNAVIDEYNYSWFTYYSYLSEHGTFPTAVYYMSNPGALIDTIVKINSEGRWSIENNPTGLSDRENNNINIHGIALWIIWIAEFFIICIFAVITAFKGIKALNPPADLSDNVQINH
jgi:hypothetical protein